MVRNGFTSFQVVVQAPAETSWWLFIGQNPENAVKITMYKESGGLLETEWISPIHPRERRCSGWICGPPGMLRCSGSRWNRS